ncbi:MAG: 50S ribosomal protein L2 [Candidatus Diapherotrites archaeon]|nr:50S ribosomal protein L2 [Candidatus Diapherotrites archaeon]
MGKPITPQKRGKGSPRYTAPSHRYKTEAHYSQGEKTGKVIGFEDDPSKTGIVMKVQWEDGRKEMYLAPEGIRVNDEIAQGGGELTLGSVLSLADIPEGVPIFNIENKPGDGGKAARASGSSAYIVAKQGVKARVRMPSKHIKTFNVNCRATVGVSAGGGRTEKPIVKAGTQFHKRRARGQLFPVVRGVAMNPIEHPHGGSQHHSGKATTVKRSTPPGRKVGHIAARRTGRRKR